MPRPTPKGRKPYSATSGPKKGPKSFKADGSPKQRWSSERRSAEGHTPRRPGQGRSFDRDDRRSFDRDDRRSFGRDDRRSFGRDERRPVDRTDRRPVDRDDRGPAQREDGRTDSQGRNFQPWKADQERRGYSRDDRREGGRDERRGYSRDDRGERRGYNRDDRGYSRDDRGFNREDRKPYGGDDRGFDRDDRPRREGRPEYRPARPVRTDRTKAEPRYDRKPWEKGERPQRRDDFRREDRRDDFRRDERPRVDRDDRRDDRPRFDREDRPQRRSFDREERPRSNREERPRFDRDDRRQDSRGDQHRHDDQHESDSDMMSWTATDLGEIDASEVNETEGFAALGVPAILVAALDRQGITSPFPIQAATIPDAIAGRDVLGRGRTGSGKTLGFGLPLLTRISQNRGQGKAPQALVLVPTRELALQCADVISPLAKALGLETTLIAGGMSYTPQLRAFDRGVDIVVATPGRLIDLMEQGAVDLSQVQVTVLDEADHMADLGFMPAVTTLLDAVPTDGQRLLFSATLDGAVDTLVKRYLHDPVTHEVDGSTASVTTMEHVFLHVLPHDKNATTAAIANREGRSVLFARTQMGASRVAEQLRAAGVMAGALHGGLTQGARTRILAAFKEGTVPVLVATDVAARGIHVDDVTLVLEIDPPMNSKDYLHRAGRTARAGTKGVVASIVLPHQRRTMQRIADGAGVTVAPIQVRPSDELLAETTGARAPQGMPIEDADYEKLISPRKQAPRGGGRGFKSGGFKRGGGGYRGQGGDRRGGGYRGHGGERRGDWGGERRGGQGWRRDN